jgi:hypothetical protein
MATVYKFSSARTAEPLEPDVEFGMEADHKRTYTLRGVCVWNIEVNT